MSKLDFAAVQAARARLENQVYRTPLMSSRYFNQLLGADVLFKCENLQRVGSFKVRGAMNAISAEMANGGPTTVITHSSGNHGQAVAYAASHYGIPATVVMPHDTAKVKIDAVREYGATVVFSESGTRNRECKLAELVASTPTTVVHSYDNDLVIAGQGTAASEFLEDASQLDVVLAPVGGGGLLAGTILALAGTSVQVFGAEPEKADDAAQSLAMGHIVAMDQTDTIADGLRARALVPRTFAIIRSGAQGILTVSEDDITTAMRLVWERMKILIEPSAAVPVAAAIRYRNIFQGKSLGIILSGGNIDLDKLPW